MRWVLSKFLTIAFRRLLLVCVAPVSHDSLCSADPGVKTAVLCRGWPDPAGWVSADRNPILPLAGVSFHRIFYISSLVPLCDEFSCVVEFKKLFRDFSRFASFKYLCNFMFSLYHLL